MQDVVKKALEYEGIITKRYVLKVIASIYNPIELLSPVTNRFKIILQEICQSKYGWDEEISKQLKIKWNTLLTSAMAVEKFYLTQNYLGDRSLCDVVVMELHRFCDASKKAYAAVVYIRIVFIDRVTVNSGTDKILAYPTIRAYVLPNIISIDPSYFSITRRLQN